jgi:hypothetical protein
MATSSEEELLGILFTVILSWSSTILSLLGHKNQEAWMNYVEISAHKYNVITPFYLHQYELSIWWDCDLSVNIQLVYRLRIRYRGAGISHSS